VVATAIRQLWAEPPAPNPPRRVWRDWALVAVLVPTALVEAALRPEAVWRPLALVVCLGLTLTLLWRRTHPLAVTAVAFGSLAAMDAAAIGAGATGVELPGLYTTAFVVLLPYALFRWGSGRDAVIGLGFMLVSASLATAGDFNGVGEAVVGFLVLLFPAVIGVTVRTLVVAQERSLEQVRLREREQLARDLHDSVAHHVSAVVLRAQAGRYLARTDPEAAGDALAVIEDEASQALAEMRAIVGVLRKGEGADLAPTPGVADIERLAHAFAGPPRIEVDLEGELHDLAPSVDAAIFRIAQESITNATRHARDATRITVRVVGDEDAVRLTVADDGASRSGVDQAGGFGLAGMNERATLLGGTFEAGPQSGRGWTVAAVVPKAATPA
jgi:signal transduction histidine kinase